MHRKENKVLSMLLAVILVFSLLPVMNVSAAPASSVGVNGSSDEYLLPTQVQVKTVQDYKAEQDRQATNSDKPEIAPASPDATASEKAMGRSLFTADTPVMDTVNQRFYANGTPIVIKNNGPIESIYDSSNNLLSGTEDVYYYEIFGGWESGTNTGDTSIIIEDPYLNCNVYGGSRDGVLIGDTSVVVDGAANIFTIFGGNDVGELQGSASVVINAGNIDSVYGGSRGDRDADDEEIGAVTGDTYVEINGGSFPSYNDIYGGGSSAAVKGNTEVVINSTASISLNAVYGGGWYGSVGQDTSIVVDGAYVEAPLYGGGCWGDVGGDTSVEVKNGAYIDSQIAGGGYGGTGIGTVYGDTSVAVEDSTVTYGVIGGGQNGSVLGETTVGVLETYIGGWVIGGGYDGSVSSSTNVVITDCEVIGRIIGGGYNASVHSTSITVNPGVNPTDGIYGALCGGGQNGQVAFDTNVVINGGTFSNVICAGGASSYATTGGTSLTVNGGSLAWAYGGGWDGNVYGDTEVAVTGGNISAVYGGGCWWSEVDGGTSVTVSGGYIGYVYGGGQGPNSGGSWGQGAVTGNTSVTVTNGTVWVALHGGGNNATATVGGTADVKVKGGTFDGNNYPDGGIYGGGHYGDVTGAAVVNVWPTDITSLNAAIATACIGAVGAGSEINYWYHVIYALNSGGGTAPTQVDVIGGQTFTAAQTVGMTAPAGNIFKEWNTQADGGGTNYARGDTVTMPSDNLTLYAIWEAGIQPVTGITVNGTGSLTAISTIGGTLQMEVDVQPPNADDPSVTWAVDDESLASISSTGLLTAKRNGTVTVTATANDSSGIDGSCQITLSNQAIPVASITVATSSGGPAAINTTGGTLQLTATASPGEATDKTVTWSLNNTNVDQIDQTGLLTGKINGTVTVTATANDCTAVFGQLSVTIGGQYNQNDIDMIKAFLSQSDGLKTNAEKLGIDVNDISTWTDVVWWEEIGGLYRAYQINMQYPATTLQSAPLHGALDLSGCEELTYIDVGENNLTGINLSGCSALEGLRATGNQLALLNVAGCGSLENIYCSGNNLQSLDLSSCLSLILLDCANNPLGSLNLSACADLRYLWCSDTGLNNLDVSGCPNLLEIEAHGNTLNNLSALKALSLELLTYNENGADYTVSNKTLPNGSPRTLTVKSGTGGFAAGDIQNGLVDGRYDITLYVYPDQGFRFARWENALGLTVIGLSGSYTDIYEALSSTGTMSITAIFEPVKNNNNYSSGGGGGGTVTHAVTFETNGGSAVSHQTVASGSIVTKPVDPVREGYKFTGWYTEKDCKTLYNFSDKITKSFTLYAGWEKVQTPTEHDLFDDDNGHWAEKFINSLGAQGYVNGTGEQKFAPNAPLTRVQFVQIIYNAFGNGDVSSPDDPFFDTDSAAWYAKALNWAYNNGLINGYSSTMFGPNDPITREQMAALIARAVEKFGIEFPKIIDASLFTDDDKIAGYAYDAVYTMQQAMIIDGKPGNLFDPQGTLTRGEMAKVMYFLLDYAGKIAAEYKVD